MQSPSIETVTWRSAGGVELMTWPVLEHLHVDIMMSARNGGVSSGPYESLNLGLHVGDDESRVIENRRRAAEAFGASLDDLVVCDQTHGRQVTFVSAADRGRGARSRDTAITDTDATITTEVGLVLVMLMADCVPIGLYDPKRHVAAAVHAGWRGTVARVAEAAIEAMVSLGSSPVDVLAVIGPAVDPDRYEVGPEVHQAALECFGADAGELLCIGRRDTSASPAELAYDRYLFDLWEANRRILLEAGVPPSQVHLAPIPTGGEQPFFSDRERRPCGRHGLFVRLRARS